MTIELINKGGSGGAPTTLSLGTFTQVSSGASGTIITIPAVAGQRAVLTTLNTQGSTPESDITVNIGGSPIISGGTLDDNNAARTSGTFVVGNRNGQAAEPVVVADPNEDITVVKDTGTTSATINYSFMYVR